MRIRVTPSEDGRGVRPLRPLGVRYRPYGPLRIVFDPLSVAYVAPVLGEGPTIQRIEYRTDVGLEFIW